MMPRGWLALILVLASAAASRAEEWIEMTPENIALNPMVVDAFLADVYGEGYPANPLARTDAYVGYVDGDVVLLVHNDALCDAEGCPLLRYHDMEEGVLPIEERKIHYRLVGSMALVRIGGIAQVLYAEPERSDFRTSSGLPIIAALEARFGPVLHDTQKIDLADVFVGSADLNGDGVAEYLISVRDPDRNCGGFNPGCATGILQQGGEAVPGAQVLQLPGEAWIRIGQVGWEFLPCRGGGRCIAVMLLDEQVGGYHSLLDGRGKKVWNPDRHYYDWVELEGFPQE